jgi:Na+-driven multidrug efflux pump
MIKFFIMFVLIIATISLFSINFSVFAKTSRSYPIIKFNAPMPPFPLREVRILKAVKHLWNKIHGLFGFIDLTEGNVLRKLIQFSIPIFLTYLLTNLLSLANSLVLKNTVGGDSVTAMSQTNSLNSIILQFALGCASGFAVVGGNYQGAKNEEKLQQSFGASIRLSFIIGAILSVVGFAILRSALGWLNVADVYFEKAYWYFFVILCGFIIMIFNQLVIAYLRILGNSFYSMIVSLLTLALHVLLCFLFTSPNLANLDTVGCALSTGIIDLISLAANYIFLIKKYPLFRLSRKSFKFDWSLEKELLAQGLPLGFQWSILFIGSFVVTSQINLFGAAASKGMGVASNVEGYSSIIYSTTSASALAFASQNNGARHYRRIRQCLWYSLLIDFISYLIIFALGYSVLIPYSPYIFLPANEVNERVMFYCSVYLYIVFPSLILQGILTVCRSILQGIKKPLIPLLSGIGELVMRIVIALFLPLLVDANYRTTHSDSSYIAVSFSTMSAWTISVLIMGVATLICLYHDKAFQDETSPSNPKEKIAER